MPQASYRRGAASLAAALAAGRASAAGDVSRLAPPGVRTTVANSLWGNDAFPRTPAVPVGGNLTIGYWNASGGGRVTHIHLVLEGPPRGELQRHVALSITYDDAAFPSVFVPVGDFFIDQDNSQSNNFESAMFAKRPTNSWFCFAPMPYRKSIRIALHNKASRAVAGYNYIYHDNVPFQAGVDAYFHAYYAANSLLSFPWQPAPLLPAEGVEGPGHLAGTALVFTSSQGDKFRGTFEHVCEGNYELFLDNTTAKYGNDSANNYVGDGYQTSDDVIAILGSEDWYGYSFGWAGDEVKLGSSGLYGSQHTGTTLWQNSGSDAQVILATYRFFEAPIRFAKRLYAQVNWGYDLGHNVPTNLCPAGSGCPISYEVVSYLYLAQPRDASADSKQFPWPYPLTPPPAP